MTTDPRIQQVFGHDPVVPNDEVELNQILKLIDKVPTYLEKLTELTIRVQELAKIAGPLTFSSHQEIERLIFRAFYVDLENRPFRDANEEDLHRHISRMKADSKLEGVITARNLGCEVCGENRSTDRCHIIPAKLGGSAEANNILLLCPTHHRLFDRFMLSRSEYAAIDWERKSEPSRHYADRCTLLAHSQFWESVGSGTFRRVGQYDNETKPFVEYVLSQVLGLFEKKRLLKRASVYKVIDPNARELAKKVVAHLVKIGLLVQAGQEGDGFFALVRPDTVATEELVLSIWQSL